MSYIGYTPWKKFKKLFLLSKGIIHAYGLRYFLYVVKLELKKQGLSVFTPDAKPIPLYQRQSFQEKYHVFLENMEKHFENEFKSDKLSSSPLLSIIISLPFQNLHDLEISLNSIKNQIYSNWKVNIIPINNNENISSKINQMINDNPKISVLNIDNSTYLKSILNNQSDFIGFLKPGTVLSPFSIFQFVKTLNENPNYDILYSDHDFIDKSGIHEKPFFKPDWSPYIFRSMDYISPFYVIKKSIIENISQLDFESCTDFDILIHSIEKAKNIKHIPLPIASLTKIHESPNKCHKFVLRRHLKRMNINAKIENGIIKDTFRIHYELNEQPKVSIIIPTKNNHNILKRCINSIEKKTNYKNWEIIVIDNSNETLLPRDLIRLKNYYNSLPYCILTYSENFNFSKMNNLAVKSASGDLLLFLNDDTKVVDPYWLDELVSIILQKDVGVVGPKLIYSDNTIQHAGMVFLKTGSGFHPFMKEPENSSGYHNLLNIMRECSAVTGACLLTKKIIFEEIGGFDNLFDAYYGDSDLCLKIRKLGYRIIYTPFTKLIHEGSFSIRGTGASYFAVESHQDFIKKWPTLKQGDPFYNPNLGWNYDIE